MATSRKDIRGIGPVPEGLSEELTTFLNQARNALMDVQAGRVAVFTATKVTTTTGSSGSSGGSSGGSDEPDLTPPPTPSGVNVVAGIDFIGITTDAPTFSMGHGYGRTLVYGKKYSGTGPLPTFSDDSLAHEFVGQVGSFPTDPATQWHIWVKWRSSDGVLSVTPAGGANGFQVTTGQDPAKLLEMLSGQIRDEQLFADLGSRIDLIDAPDTVPGSVAARIKTEATTRAGETGALFAQYTIKLDVGGKVSGFGLASSSTSSSFAIRADRFYIAAPSGVSGVGDIIPFAVQATPTLTPAGELLPAGVYIDAAYVRNLEAALGRFQNAFITNAMIVSVSASRITSGVISVGAYIQSSNYVPGVSGWRIHGDGSAVFRGLQILGDSYFDGQVTIRRPDGTVQFTSGGKLAADDVVAAPGWLNSNLSTSSNLVWNSDQSSAMSMGTYTYPGVPIGITLRHASELWTSTYVLRSNGTRNLAVSQLSPIAGGDDAPALDIHVLGTWSEANSVPVKAGQRYIFSCYLASHRCKSAVGMAFFDYNGNNVGDYMSAGYAATEGGADNLSAYVRGVCVATAPASASYVRPFVRKLNTASGQSDSWFWLAAPMLEATGSTATAPSEYSQGPAKDARQLGYIGDLDATKGATWGSNLNSVPANLAALSGSEAIKNELLSPAIAAAAQTANWSSVADKPAFGTFAALSQITYENVTTYIAGAAIGLAHINTATIINLAALNTWTGSLTIGDGSGSSTGWLRIGATDFFNGAGAFLGWVDGEIGLRLGDAESGADWIRWRASTGWQEKRSQMTLTLSGGAINHTTSSTGVFNIGSRSVLVGDGTAPYSYLWSVVPASGMEGAIYINGAVTNDSVSLRSQLNNPGDSAGATLVLTVTDATGRSKSVSIGVTSTNTA